MYKAKKTIAVDIPNTVIIEQTRNSEKTIQDICREILTKAMPNYFDDYGNFTGIKVGFYAPVYLSDGKQRINPASRITFSIDEETAYLLGLAKRYTSISSKNFAEIVILKNMLEGENGYAKDCIVPDKQGDAPDNQPQHSRKRACNI